MLSGTKHLTGQQAVRSFAPLRMTINIASWLTGSCGFEPREIFTSAQISHQQPVNGADDRSEPEGNQEIGEAKEQPDQRRELDVPHAEGLFLKEPVAEGAK